MQNSTEYFVVMVSYRSGSEGIVNPNFVWSDVLDIVNEAAGDGNPICFVHHIKDGKATDRTQEALDRTRDALADYGDPLTNKQRDWIEHHHGLDVARHFRRVA